MDDPLAIGNIRHTPRCGYCRYKGHTRRHCFVLRAHRKWGDPVPAIEKSTKESDGMLPVLVRTYGRMDPSPHMVDLRSGGTHAVWEDAPLYAESAPVRIPAVTLDFAAVIEAARTLEDEQRVAHAATALVPVDPLERIVLHVRLPDIAGILRRRLSAIPAIRLPLLRAAAAACALLLAVPFPAIGYYQRLKENNATVVAESTNGFLALQSSTVAALHGSMGSAATDLTKALQSFAAASDVLEHEHEFLLSLVKLLPFVGAQVESRQALLSAGQHLALGNTYMVKGIREAEDGESVALTDRFGIIRSHLRSAIPQYEAALVELYRVQPEAIPVEYQASFEQFRTLFQSIVAEMRDVTGLVDALKMLFGGDAFRRYLVVFQNQHELRPTGGFMGSFAVVDVEKGKIQHIEVPPGGTYDLQGQLSVHVKPPAPLLLVNGRWEMQDANWFPDFSASAEKIAWFYEHSRGATIDGVIAVNGSVLERLLRVTGPIASEEYGLVLTSDTVLASLERVIESDEARATGKPKAILSGLLEQAIALSGSVEGKRAMTLLTELLGALDEKDIQVFVRDAAAQAVFREFGWTGEIRRTGPGQDYLSVIGANLQGQKSDARMKQSIEHQAVIAADGSVMDTVVVRRTHTGVAGESLYGASNINYLRFYVPEGATLVEAGGFTYPDEGAFHAPESWYADDSDVGRLEQEERIDPASGTRVTREFGKTVFGNWVIVPPGETREAFVTYRLPWRISRGPRTGLGRVFVQTKTAGGRARGTSSYTLAVQRQSGAATDFSTRIVYPEGWMPVWRSDESLHMAQNGATFGGPLSEDKVFGILMEDLSTTL